MSASLRLLAISPESLARLRRHPELVEILVCSVPRGRPAGVAVESQEQREAVLQRLPELASLLFLDDWAVSAIARLIQKGGFDAIRPELIPLLSELEQQELDLDKRWRKLSYFLRRTSPEGVAFARVLLEGGRGIGADLGYGPARCLGPEETRETAAAIAARSPEELQAAFVLEREDVGPDLFEGEQNLRSVWDSTATVRALNDYVRLRSFFLGAVSAERAVLLYYM